MTALCVGCDSPVSGPGRALCDACLIDPELEDQLVDAMIPEYVDEFPRRSYGYRRGTIGPLEVSDTLAFLIYDATAHRYQVDLAGRPVDVFMRLLAAAADERAHLPDDEGRDPCIPVSRLVHRCWEVFAWTLQVHPSAAWQALSALTLPELHDLAEQAYYAQDQWGAQWHTGHRAR